MSEVVKVMLVAELELGVIGEVVLVVVLELEPKVVELEPELEVKLELEPEKLGEAEDGTNDEEEEVD